MKFTGVRKFLQIHRKSHRTRDVGIQTDQDDLRGTPVSESSSSYQGNQSLLSELNLVEVQVPSHALDYPRSYLEQRRLSISTLSDDLNTSFLLSCAQRSYTATAREPTPDSLNSQVQPSTFDSRSLLDPSPPRALRRMRPPQGSHNDWTLREIAAQSLDTNTEPSWQASDLQGPDGAHITDNSQPKRTQRANVQLRTQRQSQEIDVPHLQDSPLHSAVNQEGGSLLLHGTQMDFSTSPPQVQPLPRFCDNVQPRPTDIPSVQLLEESLEVRPSDSVSSHNEHGLSQLESSHSDGARRGHPLTWVVERDLVFQGELVIYVRTEPDSKLSHANSLQLLGRHISDLSAITSKITLRFKAAQGSVDSEYADTDVAVGVGLSIVDALQALINTQHAEVYVEEALDGTAAFTGHFAERCGYTFIQQLPLPVERLSWHGSYHSCLLGLQMMPNLTKLKLDLSANVHPNTCCALFTLCPKLHHLEIGPGNLYGRMGGEISLYAQNTPKLFTLRTMKYLETLYLTGIGAINLLYGLVAPRLKIFRVSFTSSDRTHLPRVFCDIMGSIDAVRRDGPKHNTRMDLRNDIVTLEDRIVEPALDEA
ncbi:hypothetical protein DL96DRAFT_1598331 [Flagelloscypha sp. PMI_526]|nr:hypothetical protein DL96DRAFT_1598331 [Flagelloscypha sp. PMI_526]